MMRFANPAAGRIDSTIPPHRLPRLGVFRDFAEEEWPSMDLCAEMLIQHLEGDYRERLAIVEMRPPFRRRVQRLPWVGRRSIAFNADRLLNRFWDYPRHARQRRTDAEVFHVVDHSYSQLLESLPAGRTGVFCHDLDTFRCLLTPELEPRPRWFRAMATRILNGLRSAAIVFYTTAAVREQIARHQLVDETRLIHAPLGFAPEYRPDPTLDAEAQSVWRSIDHRPYVLHVGSCIPRKRIDVLLKVFARLSERLPELRLVKVGGEWSLGQRDIIDHRGLTDRVVHLARIGRSTLACLYQRAGLVLMPSEAEGFGLPVLEALACGAPVLASDLPVFREVAGSAARYAPVADFDAFVAMAEDWIRQPASDDAIRERVAQAGLFSWRRHAQIIGDAYLRLAQ